MFEIIGILAVIAVIGFIIFAIGYNIFTGALKLGIGLIVLVFFIFAMRGCMMG